MSFKFGLFRVLSIINLVVSGLFLFVVLLAALFTQQLQVLIGLFLVGATVIHSWLSYTLYRSINNPENVLKENTPGGIRIIGALSALFAFMMLSAGASVLGNAGFYATEALKLNPDPILQKNQPMVVKFYQGMAVFMLIYGISLMVNYLLSMHFLQIWKYRQETEKEQEVEDLF